MNFLSALSGQGQQDKITYRANAGEIRLWAKLVDSLGMKHNNLVMLISCSDNQLMPFVPIPNSDKFVAEYNQLMRETIEEDNAAEAESPVADIIEEIENGKDY